MMSSNSLDPELKELSQPAVHSQPITATPTITSQPTRVAGPAFVSPPAHTLASDNDFHIIWDGYNGTSCMSLLCGSPDHAEVRVSGTATALRMSKTCVFMLFVLVCLVVLAILGMIFMIFGKGRHVSTLQPSGVSFRTKFILTMGESQD